MTKTLTEQQTRKIIENVTGKAAKVCEQRFYEKPKSLTELWKDGELPSGFYYVSIPGAVCGVSILYDYELQAYKSVRDSDKIEVLSPVPSYDEYKELVKKVELLEFDNDVLNSVADQQDDKLIAMDKEMAEMRKQIMQANRVIKKELRRQSPKGGVLIGDMNDYLKKWGVK